MIRYDDEEYLTAEEACAVLGVKRRTLERYAEGKKKRIQKYKRGLRSVVFKRSDVLRLKQELEEVKPVDE